MAMTYAALAKSLGLSLGRSSTTQASSSPASTTSSAPPTNAPTATETSNLTSGDSLKKTEVAGSSTLKRKSEELETPPSPTKKNKDEAAETAGTAEEVADEAAEEAAVEVGSSSDVDAEGETDIASSRPPSPCNAPPLVLTGQVPSEAASKEDERTDSPPTTEEASSPENCETSTDTVEVAPESPPGDKLASPSTDVPSVDEKLQQLQPREL